MSKIWTFSLALILSFVLNPTIHAEDLGHLEAVQDQVTQSISDSKKAGQALIALEYVRGKFYPTSDGQAAPWEVLSGDSATAKPRISVKRSSENVDRARVARWVLREEKNSEGICIPLRTTHLSSVAATDCTSRNTELLIDDSGLAGVEQISALTPEDEQQGVVGELSLSKEEREQFMTDPNFRPQRLTSKVQSLKLVFKKIIGEKEKRFLELEVGGVLARIQLPSLQELQYVESGTGRILSVALPPITARNLASISCPVVSHQVKGCTGLGSAPCESPKRDLAQPFHRFCRPPSGALGNYIEGFLKKGSVQYFFTSFGQLFNSNSEATSMERKFVSVVPAGDGWAALRSDGAVFRGKEIDNLNSFVLDPCLRLERADFLISKEQGEMSCL